MDHHAKYFAHFDAAAALTDLFDGQPQGGSEYAVINKLLQWFEVDTQLGKYNPEWAILTQRG